MNTEIITETARKILAGTISFPEVIPPVTRGGVEYYQVDYVGLRKTFYSTDGDVAVTPINYEGLPPAIFRQRNAAPTWSRKEGRFDLTS